MKTSQFVRLALLQLVAAQRWHDGYDQHNSDVSHAILTAYTSNGPVTGHVDSNDTSVIEYLGIPYAQPPVGDLRFAPAQAYDKYEEQVASAYGYDCPAAASPPLKYPGLTPQAQRISNYFTGMSGTTEDEDCLTLNVWQPRSRPGRESTKLPVIVYFYGGRFTTGNSNTPFTNGALLAGRENIVVVTINFRSYIFGYPGVPGQTQNLGLRDQRLAVEWVARNAHAFGGDASRIVIMGQSAGAVAVDYYSYAWTSDPIISGMISHSGNAFSFPLNADGIVEKNWYNVSAQLGCGGSGDTLTCMRTKSWQSISNAAAKIPSVVNGSPLRSTPGFYPIVDNETVFGDYTARSRSGAFAKIPYLLGNCDNEQGFYALLAAARGGNTTIAQGDSFLLSSFTCPNYFEATNRQKNGVPVHLFRYFGDWDNLRLFPTSGAYHGSDVDVLFGNDGAVSGIPPSSPEEQTTRLLQAIWAAFARDPVKGLVKLGIPAFDPESASLIRLAYNNTPTASFVSPQVYAAPCANVTIVE